ncbi:MAG: periplasmic heavy metal sensor, partial [Acidobacteriota bacterium]
MNHNPFQKKLFGAATMVLAATLAAGAALAQPGPGPGKFARGIRAAMATLDLTDSQKEKVKAIFASHKDEGVAFHTQAKADRQALKAAASAAKPDPAVVGAAFLKVRGDGEAARAKMKAVRTEIDAVLTPEQRAKLDGWIAAHRQQR